MRCRVVALAVGKDEFDFAQGEGFALVGAGEDDVLHVAEEGKVGSGKGVGRRRKERGKMACEGQRDGQSGRHENDY